ncbi:dicarboxylate/amino acid:cation symporter [Parendozoicomonas haliclonae]|uniref:Serine/threonine transporter SstT n=1 Tax=Parendozoicomonas haliclonae TaxID=1960125 RepID=A0A1X7AMJ6_9GAMM|nr:dicarboxylate/amino acid:cation symporter [Parendozoicomonas haliclonae]SMA49520.1 Serine/threonine transporter SstT [Parendozoicomonas haliclonae]
MKLIIRLVLGVAAGILAGLYGPEFLIKLLVTFKTAFGQFLGFTVPLIILFYITSGIGSLTKGSGRILGVTLLLAYLSTICAGLVAYTVSSGLLPDLVPKLAANLDSGEEILPWLVIELAPLMDVGTALVLAFMFGMGISITHGKALLKATEQGKYIIELVLVNVIIPLLPFYICGVFAEMGASGTVFRTLETFAWVLGVAIVLHWVWLLVMFSIAGGMARKNPISMIKTMLPSYMTAIGTLSSAATIPVTVDCVRKLKVNNHVVDFTVPLCATIHLAGSATTLTVCTIAVAFLETNQIPTPAQFIPFLLTLGVAMVAAPGIPGGAVMASLGLLSSMMGFDSSAIAMMIALYLAQDSFGTACNVTGDGAIATVVGVVSEGRWQDE